jgi:hypothetical protein
VLKSAGSPRHTWPVTVTNQLPEDGKLITERAGASMPTRTYNRLLGAADDLAALIS